MLTRHWNSSFAPNVTMSTANTLLAVLALASPFFIFFASEFQWLLTFWCLWMPENVNMIFHFLKRINFVKHCSRPYLYTNSPFQVAVSI